MSPTTTPAFPGRRAFWQVLVVAVALFCAQVLLAGHAAEHIGHIEDASCEICLMGAALGSLGPVPASSPSVPQGATPQDAQPGTEGFLEGFYRSQRARAPPTPTPRRS